MKTIVKRIWPDYKTLKHAHTVELFGNFCLLNIIKMSEKIIFWYLLLMCKVNL